MAPNVHEIQQRLSAARANCQPVKLLVKDATEGELKQARNSSEYKEAYDTITEQLAKVPKEKAVEACTAFVEKQ